MQDGVVDGRTQLVFHFGVHAPFHGILTEDPRAVPGCSAVANGFDAYVQVVARAQWIVVGTDFSDGAQRALEHAVRLARASGARIAVVHAYEDGPEVVGARGDRAPALRAQLQDAVAGTSACRDGVHVERFLRRGAPWEKLLNVAVEVGADLIIVGATGQRGVEATGPVLGRVAYRVLASSTRSVLISRPLLDVARGVEPHEPT